MENLWRRIRTSTRKMWRRIGGLETEVIEDGTQIVKGLDETEVEIGTTRVTVTANVNVTRDIALLSIVIWIKAENETETEIGIGSVGGTEVGAGARSGSDDRACWYYILYFVSFLK